MIQKLMVLAAWMAIVGTGVAQDAKPNEWIKVSENAVGPRFSPAQDRGRGAENDEDRNCRDRLMPVLQDQKKSL